MQAEMVDQCISNYREYSARCDYLEKEIAELEKWLQSMRNTFIEDNIHVTATISDMPHGTGISNPVEKLAFMAIEEFTPDYMKKVECEIQAKKKELAMKRPIIRFVDAWMNCLTPRERFVVQNKNICGMFWRELVFAYQKEYGEGYTRQGLKNIRDKAMDKIYRIAE